MTCCMSSKSKFRLLWILTCSVLAHMMEILQKCLTRGKLWLNPSQRPPPLPLGRAKPQLYHCKKRWRRFKSPSNNFSLQTHLTINCFSAPFPIVPYLQLQGHVQSRMVSCSGREPQWYFLRCFGYFWALEKKSEHVYRNSSLHLIVFIG